MSFNLPKPVADLVDAANRFDLDGFMEPFAENCMVNDRHRQFWGKDAVRKWCDIEITGDHVTMDVRDVVDHYGDIILTAKLDGDFDKSELPADFRLEFYITLRDEKIVQIILMPQAGRELSKPTPTSEAATAYSAPVVA
ncbi:MAG: nuclear transport factor 2 family protein [Alphaproteobacteria bacterium]|nr:nuclear transport factor 2 family protein [Alphaproteobacteria bacterium]